MATQDRPPLIVDTASLKDTIVVPSLDSPVPSQKSAMWCGSFLAAWQRMEELLGATIQFEGTEAIPANSWSSRHSSEWLPPGESYSLGGWVRQGVIGQIQSDMARLFPDRPVPSFPQLPGDALVGYGYLQCSIRFPIPYFDSRMPLQFVDVRGRSTPVYAFGMRQEDSDAYFGLREQVKVLFNETGESQEFALDLCRHSSQIQVVFARIRGGDTLARMSQHVEERALHAPPRPLRGMLYPRDVMLIPNMNWKVTHWFNEPSGMATAVQETRFRLDKSGVELQSEAKAHSLGGGSHEYLGDAPFLLYIKRREAAVPFFAVWIETAELLEKMVDVPVPADAGAPEGRHQHAMVGRVFPELMNAPSSPPRQAWWRRIRDRFG